MIKLVFIFLIGYSVQATTILGGAGANRFVVAGGGGNSVTIDAVGATNAIAGGSAGNQTLTIAVSSHSNRALAVLVGAGSFGASGTNNVPTSDQGGTFVRKAVSRSGSWGYAEMWVMVNPTVATHTITIIPSTSFTDRGAACVSLYNVDQTTPTAASPVQATGAASPITTGSVTLTTGQMLIAVCGTDSQATCDIAGTGGAGTLLGTFPILNINTDTAVGAGYRTTTGAVAFAETASQDWAIIGVVFNPQ